MKGIRLYTSVLLIYYIFLCSTIVENKDIREIALRKSEKQNKPRVSTKSKKTDPYADINSGFNSSLKFESQIHSMIQNQGFNGRQDFTYFRNIDDGIVYSLIQPYEVEWNRVVNLKGDMALAPFHFWFKCIGREVRAYFFIYDIKALKHKKETVMLDYDLLKERINITVEGERVPFDAWHGGGDFYFSLNREQKAPYNVEIRIEGFMHYILFPTSSCSNRKIIPNFSERSYIMHVHLREYRNGTQFNRMVLNGIAKHLTYHRCLLGLHNYEVVVQREQIPYFLGNKRLRSYIDQGLLTLIVRNPLIPGPIAMPVDRHIKYQGDTVEGEESNCFWQPYTENMALLRHWLEPNTRIFFMDSDEYIILNGNMTREKYVQLLDSGPALAISRTMSFCYTCPANKPELRYLSFKDQKYKLYKRLEDPKLLVDPNSVGCFIVHWAGCGVEAVSLPASEIQIIHFENLYRDRWTLDASNMWTKMQPLAIGPLTSKCDPSLYDLKLPKPWFSQSSGEN